jgi:hypothetical protein
MGAIADAIEHVDDLAALALGAAEVLDHPAVDADDVAALVFVALPLVDQHEAARLGIALRAGAASALAVELDRIARRRPPDDPVADLARAAALGLRRGVPVAAVADALVRLVDRLT